MNPDLDLESLVDPENLSDVALEYRQMWTEVNISPMFILKTGGYAAIAETHYREWDGKTWVDEFGHPRNDDGRLLDEFDYIIDGASPSIDSLDNLDREIQEGAGLSELYLTLVSKDRIQQGLGPLTKEVRKLPDRIDDIETRAAAVRAYLNTWADGRRVDPMRIDWAGVSRLTARLAPVDTDISNAWGRDYRFATLEGMGISWTEEPE